MKKKVHKGNRGGNRRTLAALATLGFATKWDSFFRIISSSESFADEIGARLDIAGKMHRECTALESTSIALRDLCSEYYQYILSQKK
jgi:hypothetical protein